VLLRDEHFGVSPRDPGPGIRDPPNLRSNLQFVLTACTSAAFFIWKGALLTMPMTSADHL